MLFTLGFVKCLVIKALIIYSSLTYLFPMETVNIRKDALKDLIKVKDEFDSIVESLELMSDEEFMKSYKKSKSQIKKKEFDNWDDL